jgi:hypothetical protein
MKALKSRAAVIAGAVLASSAMLVPLAAPAGAATVVDGCSFTANPASGGSQSALRVACNFPTAASVPASNVISDFSNAVWHNGAARAVNGIAYDGGGFLGNLTVVASPNAHFTAADVNRQIAGTINGAAIGAYTNIKVVLSANAVALNMPATTTGVSGKVLADGIVVDAKLENSSIRAGVGAVTLASATASATVSFVKGASVATATKATTAFNAGDVGKQIVSTKLVGGSAIIAAVNGSGVATLSVNATATSASQSVTLNTLGTIISPTLGFASTDAGRSVAGTPISGSSKIVTTGTVDSNTSRYITGGGNPANGTDALVGFTLAKVTGTVAQSAADLTGSPAYPNQITVGADEIVSTTRIINNQTYELDTQKIVSDAGTFRGSDIGLPISGCGVQAYANGATPGDANAGQNYITEVALNGSWVKTAGGVYGNSQGLAALSGATCTQAFGAYGINLTIGLPSVSSAVNGDVMSTVASTLNLSPSLVPGSDACATNTYEGTTIQGQWYNPGFIGASSAFSGNAGSASAQSVSLVLSPALAITPIAAPTNTIGAIKYPTAVVSFWAFVSLRTSSETIADKTFAAGTAKISLPWVPTLLALCDGTGISSEYTFQGTSIGTQSIATGTGRPSTALRGLRSGAIAGDVAYQPTNLAGTASNWTGTGKFAAAGSLGQGVVAKLALK